MSEIGHFRPIFGMSTGCPVKEWFPEMLRDESCGMNQAIINGMLSNPMLPNKPPAFRALAAVFNGFPWRGAAVSESAAPFHRRQTRRARGLRPEGRHRACNAAAA